MEPDSRNAREICWKSAPVFFDEVVEGGFNEPACRMRFTCY